MSDPDNTNKPIVRGCTKQSFGSSCRKQDKGSDCPKRPHHHHTADCLMYDVIPYSPGSQMAEVRRVLGAGWIMAIQLRSPIEVPLDGGGMAWAVVEPRYAPPRAESRPPWDGTDASTVVMGCPKISFGSRWAADAALDLMTGDRGEQMHSYRCTTGCGKWHHGHIHRQERMVESIQNWRADPSQEPTRPTPPEPPPPTPAWKSLWLDRPQTVREGMASSHSVRSSENSGANE